jgi:hypothetical protein
MNGEVVGRGAYPRRQELARLTGLEAAASTAKPGIRLSGGCCTPKSGCC